jgi:hypothetical protein
MGPHIQHTRHLQGSLRTLLFLSRQ